MNKKTLVFGVSLNETKYSNFVVKRLVEKNIETVAFGLKPGVVNGVVVSEELLLHSNIHTITLYLNPKNQQYYYKYIISLKPKRVIFNPGTENPEFYALLNSNNIKFEIACTLVLLSTNQY